MSEVTERFGSVMNKPENIRNICTSAHIHHGKCISKDSRIMLENGEIMSAEELFSYCEKNGNLFEIRENEHTIYDASRLNLKVFSVNKDKKTIEIKPISLAWKLTGGTTIKLRLRNGASISTTPEHKYVVYRNSEITKLEAKDLVLGDRVVCPARIKVNSNINLIEEILFLLSNKNFYVSLKNELYEKIKTIIVEHGTNRIAKEISTETKGKLLYHELSNNRFLLKDLVNVSKILNIKPDIIYSGIKYIKYTEGKQVWRNTSKARLPANLLDLFYLAGLLFGDGSNKNFIAERKDLKKRFYYICKDLGIDSKLLQNNKTLFEILNSLFDYSEIKNRGNIKMSNFLMKCDDIHLAEFIKGNFDIYGIIDKSKDAISINSTSNGMIDDLQLALLRFGCTAVKNNNALYLSGVSAKNFVDNIGFGSEEKRISSLHLTSNICDNTGLNLVSSGNTLQAEKIMNNSFELSYIEVSGLEVSYEDFVYDITVNDNHNFVANGMFVSNTAFTDNLLAAAGLMSEKSAGDLDKGMATWQHADEQERLMTVDAANVSMVHEYQGKEYLINLIDTPGHVDFGGNVTRAMRAIDGTVVLVCASEGIMPQTETVLKQALRERVKPVLFINKVDRLIKEMLFTPEQMQKRFLEIISEFNELIEQIAEPEFKQKCKVNILDGSVAFGSARDNWALSLPYMHKKNVNFKDILKIYDASLSEEERKKWVWENAPLHEVILDMVIKHLPNPLEAQKYRIPRIWHGDPESEFGKDLLSGNKEGKIAFCVTRVMIDPKFGREMSAGRLFSGTLRTGMQVYLNNAKKYERVQQVLMYNGIKTQQMEQVVAGNVLAISGISGEAGETITLEPEHPFEELKHIFEPVVTKAIEPVKAQDLAKVVEVLKTVAKEDPSIKIKINDETGECLMSGMGELHLEIVENRIITEKGVQIKSSQPIVVYRETVMKLSREVEGKSPNKHNKFYLTVEPIAENVAKALKDGEISDTRIKKRDEALWNKLVSLGWDMKEARKVVSVYKGNIIVDDTRGIVHIGEVIDLVLDGIDQVLDAGPQTREPCYNLLIRLKDMKLHEDSIHRGPAQVMPAIREALREAMADGSAIMLEPVQTLLLESISDHMGTISKLVASKRGQMLDLQQEGNYVSIKAKLPVAEMIGLSADLRSATEGRGTFYVVAQAFEKLPYELQSKIVQQIRQRKGLSENA